MSKWIRIDEQFRCSDNLKSKDGPQLGTVEIILDLKELELVYEEGGDIETGKALVTIQLISSWADDIILKRVINDEFSDTLIYDAVDELCEELSEYLSTEIDTLVPMDLTRYAIDHLFEE